MKRKTVISMEQALAMPYATLRFVQLGWRVIRIEALGAGRGLPGDPNRYIGATVADDDRRSYFIAPNVGKEAMALNLKTPAGREARIHWGFDRSRPLPTARKLSQLSRGVSRDRIRPVSGCSLGRRFTPQARQLARRLSDWDTIDPRASQRWSP